MDDTEQLRDDESNKHLEPYVREQSAVRMQVIFCAITVVIGPITILVGAWGTPELVFSLHLFVLSSSSGVSLHGTNIRRSLVQFV